jgi:hypothetical protein
MSNKKSSNKTKIVKSKSESKLIPSDFFEDMLDEMMEYAEPSPDEAHAVIQLATSTMNAAIDLSKIVVENRIRNSQQINDNDIYQIYGESFKVIMKSTEE